MTDFAELTDLDALLYRAVLAEPGRPGAALSPRLGVTRDDLDKSVARLVAMGLLHVETDDSLVAISPMLAEAVTLGAEDLELSARRAAVEHRRETIRRLIPAWNAAFSEVVNEARVDVITESGAIANVVMHYAETCRDELLSIAPGRLNATRIDGRVRLANAYSARRGIQTRAIYQHVALRDRATRSYLNELADNGARVRLTPSVPGRGLIVDRSVALLPIPTDDPGGHGLAVVRERTVLTWILATFEQLWAEAATLEDLLNKDDDDTELDQTRAAILRLMAEGEKDETISRRLSISVRTCRRHIADYMSQVGATSRFQAGVIAARAGHADAAVVTPRDIEPGVPNGAPAPAARDGAALAAQLPV